VKVLSHGFDPQPNISTRFLREYAQLLAGFFGDLNPVPHWRIVPIRVFFASSAAGFDGINCSFAAVR
jgi:hypothetical protein